MKPTLAALAAVAVLGLYLATGAPKVAGAASSGDSSWTTNYQNALQTAKSEKKMVLLDFTGSNWCGWCMKLDKEVFSTPEFKEFAAKNLVLVKLDFPRGIDQPAAEKSQNENLARQFKIEGFPTIIVLNAEGKPVGQLGYQPGGPSAFIGALKALPQS